MNKSSLQAFFQLNTLVNVGLDTQLFSANSVIESSFSLRIFFIFNHKNQLLTKAEDIL
nr:MAG TPA: hypothetical protein [Caudoviricetes sp.]